MNLGPGQCLRVEEDLAMTLYRHWTLREAVCAVAGPTQAAAIDAHPRVAIGRVGAVPTRRRSGARE